MVLRNSSENIPPSSTPHIPFTPETYICHLHPRTHYTNLTVFTRLQHIQIPSLDMKPRANSSLFSHSNHSSTGHSSPPTHTHTHTQTSLPHPIHQHIFSASVNEEVIISCHRNRVELSVSSTKLRQCLVGISPAASVFRNAGKFSYWHSVYVNLKYKSHWILYLF